MHSMFPAVCGTELCKAILFRYRIWTTRTQDNLYPVRIPWSVGLFLVYLSNNELGTTDGIYLFGDTLGGS